MYTSFVFVSGFSSFAFPLSGWPWYLVSDEDVVAFSCDHVSARPSSSSSLSVECSRGLLSNLLSQFQSHVTFVSFPSSKQGEKQLYVKRLPLVYVHPYTQACI